MLEQRNHVACCTDVSHCVSPNSALNLCGNAAAAPAAFIYPSNASKVTYLFNNSYVSFADARRSCSENGAHLVAFK